MMTYSKKGRVGLGRVTVVVACTAAVLVACGGDTKKEPVAATAPSSPSVVAAAEAGAPEPVATEASGSANPEKQAACDALVDDANSALDAERIAVDKDCKTDADCTLIRGRACAFFCTTGAIPKVEEKEWNATVQKVKDGQCKKWSANDCSKLRTRPPPTCQDRKPWCDKGHCALAEK